MTVALSRRWALMSSSPPTVAKKYSAGALVGAKDGTLLRLPVGCVGVPEVVNYGGGRKYWWCGSTSAETGDIVIAPYDGYPIRTRDYGLSWEDVSILGSNKWETICITPAGGILAGTYGGATYRLSTDGLTKNVIAAGTFWVTARSPEGLLFGGTGGGGVMRSMDDGLSWAAVGGLTDGGFRSLACLGGGVVVAGNQGGGLWRSTNSGASWTRLLNDGSNCRCMCVTPESHIYLGHRDGYQTPGYIWKSVDGGATWKEVLSAGKALWESCCSDEEGGVYFVTEYGYPMASMDGGATWVTSTLAGSRSWRVCEALPR